MLVQLWQAEKARDLVDRLIKAAGPHRAGGLDQLFEKMRTRCSWNGARKIEWLEEQCEKLAANPYYWPTDRPDLVAAARERRGKAIVLIKRNGGRISRKKLLQHFSPANIHSMLALGEIVPLGEGMYGEPGAQRHRSTSRVIVELLAAAAGHRMDRYQLWTATGRSWDAFRNALKVLRRNGIVVTRGDTVALSRKASQKIKDNEAIQLCNNTLVWGSSPHQLDLFATSET